MSRIFRPEGREQTRIGCEVCGNYTWIDDESEGILVKRSLLKKVLWGLEYSDEACTIGARQELRKIL